MGEKISSMIFLEPVTNCETQKIVMSLKNRAPGYDDIKSDILKMFLQYICEPLTHMCNMSLIQGTFPQESKLANLIPVYKSGDPQVLTMPDKCHFYEHAKVFEKVMYTRMISFLETHKIFICNQFGFPRSHSAYMALMVVINEVTWALENGEHVVCIFPDFSKGFDTVNHDALLNKLNHYGIRGNALEGFTSFLSDRRQYVTYNGCSLSTKYIKCGVRQGSKVGPLLFLIYIHIYIHTHIY